MSVPPEASEVAEAVFWDAYPPPPLALLLRASGETTTLFSHTTSRTCWDAAVTEFERAEDACRAGGALNSSNANTVPVDGPGPSAKRRSQPSTSQLLRTDDDFFAITAQLDQMNSEVAALGRDKPPLPYNELAVDAMDERMHVALPHSLRRRCKEVSQCFSCGDTSETLRLLESIINELGADRASAPLWNSLAACYYRLGRWDRCLSATRRVLSIDPAIDTAQRRLVRVLLALDNVPAAKTAMEPFRRCTHWSDEIAATRALDNYHQLCAAHLYPHALREVHTLLQVMPCDTFEALKVQLLSLESTKEASTYAQSQLNRYPFSVDLFVSLTELTFQNAVGLPQLAMVQRQLEQAPELAKSSQRLRSLGQRVQQCSTVLTALTALWQRGDYGQVVEGCGNALVSSHNSLSDGTRLWLLRQRAAAFVELGDWYRAMDDAIKATSYADGDDENQCGVLADLLLLQAKCEEELHRFKAALQHAEASHKLNPSPSTRVYREKLRRLHAAAQQSQQSHREKPYGPRQREPEPSRGHPRASPPPQQHQPSAGGNDTLRTAFAVLSLTPTQDAGEVKRAYRAMAMQWHPDRWCGKEQACIDQAADTFKKVHDAYEYIIATLSTAS